MRAFGFLSFGHYGGSPAQGGLSARQMLHDAIDISVGADELGVNGAYFRVHHYAKQSTSPMPLLVRGRRAHAADRGRDRRDRHALREPALLRRGGRRAGPHRRRTGGARRLPRELPSRRTAAGNPSATPAPPTLAGPTSPRRSSRRSCRPSRASRWPALPSSPTCPTPRPTPRSAHRTAAPPTSSDRSGGAPAPARPPSAPARQGLNLMSSTLLTEATGASFGDLQAEQIDVYRDGVPRSRARATPRASPSPAASSRSSPSRIDGCSACARARTPTRSASSTDTRSTFGRSYTGRAGPAHRAAEGRRRRPVRRHPHAHDPLAGRRGAESPHPRESFAPACGACSGLGAEHRGSGPGRPDRLTGTAG